MLYEIIRVKFHNKPYVEMRIIGRMHLFKKGTWFGNKLPIGTLC